MMEHEDPSSALSVSEVANISFTSCSRWTNKEFFVLSAIHEGTGALQS